uniref:Putative secreted protein n=1 Tax=Rhipicephalus microplus TaxID=6941 RepID=A0A6G5A1A6_RHIMP
MVSSALLILLSNVSGKCKASLFAARDYHKMKGCIFDSPKRGVLLKCKEICQHYTGSVPSHFLTLFHLLLSKGMDVLLIGSC